MAEFCKEAAEFEACQECEDPARCESWGECERRLGLDDESRAKVPPAEYVKMLIDEVKAELHKRQPVAQA